jgi:hypothetical protein
MHCAHPALILAKRDIEHPVQAVFNSSVAPGGLGQRLGR